MLNIRCGGIRYKISLLFPAVFLIIVLYNGRIGVTAIIASALHECGHIFTMRVFGIIPKCVLVSFYGMRIELTDDVALPLTKHSAVCLAGPLVNILCGAVLLLLRVDATCVLIHFGLASVNLLPIPPLDGGLICMDMCRLIFRYDVAERIKNGIAITAVSIMIVIGVIVCAYSRTNFTLLLVALYVMIGMLFYKGN